VRDEKIAFIRVLATIMIVVCHLLQSLSLEAAFWFNLGVQIFFFMSGFLFGKKDIENIKEWYKRRITKVLIPYIILLVIMLLIERIYLNQTYAYKKIFANLIGFQGFVGCIKTMTHTWFVSYILLAYLITPILQKIITIEEKSERKFLFSLALIAISLFILQNFKVINIISAWLFNYILGYYFSRYYIGKEKNYNKFMVTLLLISIIILIIRLPIQYNTFNIKFPKMFLNNLEYIKQWSHVFIGSSLFVLLYKYLPQIKKKKLLSFFDNESYYIYLTHQIFILSQFSLIHITNNLVINIALIILASIISAMILELLTKLFFWILTRNKLKPSS